MMRHFILQVILFLLLISEGIALDLLPASLTSSDTLIVPHWVFIFLLLIGLFFDTNDTFYSILYGVIFGLLIDVVYTGVLGIYMFIYPFALYVGHLLKRLLQTNIHMTMLIALVTMIIIEVFLMFVFSIVGMVETTASNFIMRRLLPTLLANLLFLIPVYLISVKTLKTWGAKQAEKMYNER